MRKNLDGILYVKKGGTFKLALDGNASTGYVWLPHFDSTYITLTGNDYHVNDDSRMGGGGVSILSFKALKVGNTSLLLAYSPARKPNDVVGKRKYLVKITG